MRIWYLYRLSYRRRGVLKFWETSQSRHTFNIDECFSVGVLLLLLLLLLRDLSGGCVDVCRRKSLEDLWSLSLIVFSVFFSGVLSSLTALAFVIFYQAFPSSTFINRSLFRIATGLACIYFIGRVYWTCLASLHGIRPFNLPPSMSIVTLPLLRHDDR